MNIFSTQIYYLVLILTFFVLFDNTIVHCSQDKTQAKPQAKLVKAQAKLGEAQTKLGEAQTKLSETKSKLYTAKMLLNVSYGEYEQALKELDEVGATYIDAYSKYYKIQTENLNNTLEATQKSEAQIAEANYNKALKKLENTAQTQLKKDYIIYESAHKNYVKAHGIFIEARYKYETSRKKLPDNSFL